MRSWPFARWPTVLVLTLMGLGLAGGAAQEYRDDKVIRERGATASARVIAVHSGSWWSRSGPYAILSFTDSQGGVRETTMGSRDSGEVLPKVGDRRDVLYDPVDDATPVVAADRGPDSRPTWLLGMASAGCFAAGLAIARRQRRRGSDV